MFFMNDSSDRDVVVFAEAIQLSAGERFHLLGNVPAGADEELRQRVARLLKSPRSSWRFSGANPRPEAVPEAAAEGFRW